MVDSESIHRRRADIFFAVLAGVFLIIYFRFFQIQIFSSSFYKKRSDMNSVRQIPLKAPRGIIFDRNSSVIVENRPSYSLFVIPFEYHRTEYKIDIGKVLPVSQVQIEKKINLQKSGPFVPVRLKSNLDFTQLTNMEEHRIELPGFFYQAEPVRSYPSGIKACHVLGFLGEITEDELLKRNRRTYKPGDITGKSGVEKEYDIVLKGRRGYLYREVDAFGVEKGDFGGKRDIKPVPGRSIILTLDIGLQKLAEKLILHKTGSIIVMDPSTGEIFAMASSPDFKPDNFSGGVSRKIWNSLMINPSKPLLDRSIQAQLPPGSVFKLVVASAALKACIRYPESMNVCNGSFRLGRKEYKCWKEEGHGNIDLYQAIAQSCNVYFYRTGLDLGLSGIVNMCSIFGLGMKTGVDLPGEKAGLVPDSLYLDKKYGIRGWTRGMIANLAVGQGDLLVTPLQMASVVTAIAMDGKRPVPRLVKAQQGINRRSWEIKKPEFNAPIENFGKVFSVIREGMRRAVNFPKGTARAAGIKGISICGKTGTAQNPAGEPHAWFAGFGPLKNPKIVVVVVIENGGSGGSVAAPVAGKIFRGFFL
ncbi:penicillin-binding protein 2 [bacterium]|nr:penicillin-binding protein 2 [bacterium]